MNFLIVCLEKIKGFGPAVFERPHPEGSRRENILHKIAEGFRAVMEYIRDIGYERIGAGHCTDVDLVAWKTASQAAQIRIDKKKFYFGYFFVRKTGSK